MKYCSDCNDIMYPNASKDNMQLIYICRCCEKKLVIENSSDADNTGADFLVFKQKYITPPNDVDETQKKEITENVFLTEDPSTPLVTKYCNKCNKEQKVLKIRSKGKGLQSLKYVYKCLEKNCNAVWA
eukprot:GAHX01000817.1.p3 GENE.GAHX01000817.1~~GAHX01000817.1.p3  ORF type:complete len:128 (-),score=26.28 GAHX01000817.1:991-1374(-)